MDHALTSPSALSFACVPAGVDLPTAGRSIAASPHVTESDDVAHESLRTKLERFGRSSLVGIVATIVDLGVLELITRLAHLAPEQVWRAKIVSLAIGTAIQFVGSRWFAFRAVKGNIGRQMKWFALVELAAFVITLVVFHGLSVLAGRVLHIGVSTEIAGLLSGSIVYFGFSYPIWHRVFRDGKKAVAPPAA